MRPRSSSTPRRRGRNNPWEHLQRKDSHQKTRHLAQVGRDDVADLSVVTLKLLEDASGSHRFDVIHDWDTSREAYCIAEHPMATIPYSCRHFHIRADAMDAMKHLIADVTARDSRRRLW